ncbi:MAG: HAD-IIIA family hydrolase [Betaproteobacteria bacterium]|nr:MAG: HAD-IIIA family hydrolase [Betaproteobacteria bacterium]
MTFTDDVLRRARLIRAVIFDVDGVLTDGSLFFDNEGHEYKAFNSRDGHGIKMLQATGVSAVIITGRTSNVVLHRARNLGITRIYQGIEDKLEAFEQFCRDADLRPEQVACIGDDLVDLPILRRCGLAATVPEAPAEVLARVQFVTPHAGGRGAARALCELIMQAQGRWAEQLALYDR